MNRAFSSFLQSKDAPAILGCIIALVVLPFLLMAGPAHAQSGNLYGLSGAQRIQSVTPGIVVASRDVVVEARVQDKAFGATAGGLLGGMALRQLTRNTSGTDRGALMLLGAASGAWGGNAVAERVATTHAQELIVETRDGLGRVGHIAVVQPDPAPMLAIGQPVFVLNEGGRNRVVPNNSVPSYFQPESASTY